ANATRTFDSNHHAAALYRRGGRARPHCRRAASELSHSGEQAPNIMFRGHGEGTGWAGKGEKQPTNCGQNGQERARDLKKLRAYSGMFGKYPESAATVLKTARGASPSWVRIPPLPPH